MPRAEGYAANRKSVAQGDLTKKVAQTMTKGRKCVVTGSTSKSTNRIRASLLLIGLVMAMPAAKSSDGDVVATVNGTQITKKQLAEHAAAVREYGLEFARAQDAAKRSRARNVDFVPRAHDVDFQRTVLETMITDRLLQQEAASRRLTVEALNAEIDSGAKPPSDREVETYYRYNKSLYKGEEVDAIARVRKELTADHVREHRYEWLRQLRTVSRVHVYLEPNRIKVAISDAPSIGPEDAPVLIVEFIDFQCPFCAKVEPVVQRIRKTYGPKIRFVVRHNPLFVHPDAEKAAEAAPLCQHG